MEEMPIVEIGPYKFRANLQWLLDEWGGNKGELGQLAFDTRLSIENGRKRVCRLQNGSVSLRICDAEALAGVFGIPAAVLVYGTKQQIKHSWENRNGLQH